MDKYTGIYVVLIVIFTLVVFTECRKHRHEGKEDSVVSPNITNSPSSSSQPPTSNASVSADSKLTITATKRRRNHNREVYSTWTTWSRCSRKCKQKRTRHCSIPSECGASLVREERACFQERCTSKLSAEKGGKLHNKTSSFQRRKKPTPSSEFRVLYHLQSFPYSDWTPWSPCSRTCLTRRTRTCQVPKICGKKVLQEDALCYIDGSVCEKLYNKKRRRKKSSVFNEHEKDVTRVHLLDSMKCGMPRKNHGLRQFLRIIGGREAAKGIWPWQVTILNKRREPFCGGTLLAPSWVLTAAHCIRRKLFVRVGEHDLMSDEGTEQESRVQDTFIHPDYDEDTVNNDIALLLLKQPFELDAFAQPACLPSVDEEFPENVRATILGWGKRRNTAIYGTDILHQAEVPVVSAEECRQVYENYDITKNMLCAGFKKGRVDSCAGDSGGPLLYKKDEKWTVYGVTSFGEGCGQKFGIYAKVSKFVKWIRKTIGKFT